MIIQNNLSAFHAHRQHMGHNQQIAKSVQRLSTGYKINSAADDPANLGISERMRAQIRHLRQEIDGTRQSLDKLQIRSGHLDTAMSILTRMKELAVQAADDTTTDRDREKLDLEYQELQKELDNVLRAAGFHPGRQIPIEELATSNRDAQRALTGNPSASRVDFVPQADPVPREDPVRTLEEEIAALGKLLEGGVTSDLAPLSRRLDALAEQAAEEAAASLYRSRISTKESAISSMNSLDDFRSGVSRMQSALGAQISALEERLNAMEEQLINLISAESTIRDVNVAEESVRLIKAQIAADVSRAMLLHSVAQSKTLVGLLQSM